MDDSFDQLSQFAELDEFSRLMCKYNDPANPNHFKLYDFGVFGSEIIPQRGIMHIRP